MDPARLSSVSLQHPIPHQHLQQHHPQHLQQQQLSPVSSAARVIPFVRKTRPAERQRNRVKLHPGKEQHAVQHLPSQVDSFQILLPAVYPRPLHLQPLSPDIATELLYSPYSSQQSYRLSVPTYSYMVQPYIQLPFSSLPEVRSSPWLLPPILCPQIVPLHHTHCADKVYVSTTANVTTASQWTEAHAGSGGQGSMSCVKEDQKSKSHKGNPDDEDETPKENIPANLTEDGDCPGPPASLDEEGVNKHSFEECFRLLESFFAQLLTAQAEEPREEEHGEAGYLNMENISFLEYLDELCRDEEFVSKVESTVNIEALMSPLSASQDLFEEQEQEMILQEALPPSPANSNHLHGETPPVSSQSLFLDPPGSHFASSPNQNGQNSSQNEVGISCSPLLPSYLLEEPPPPNYTPLDASPALSQDDFFALILPLFPDVDPESDDTLNAILSFLDSMKVQATAPPVESPSTSTPTFSFKKKQPGIKGGEKSVTTKTLEQEVQASKENQTKVKPNILAKLGQRVSSKGERQKDKDRKKLQKKRGTQSFKRKRSWKTKLTSTAEQLLEMTKKKQLKSPDMKAGMHGELTFSFRCENNARGSGSLPNTCPESTNTFESIFWDTWTQVQKSTTSSHEPSPEAAPDLVVSPAKKHTRAWQATRKRGHSADNAGTAMDQLEPSPTKKSRKVSPKRKSEGAAKSKRS